MLQCAGRTDKGVHAVGLVVTFYSWEDIPEERLMRALQGADPRGHIVPYQVTKHPRR